MIERQYLKVTAPFCPGPCNAASKHISRVDAASLLMDGKSIARMEVSMSLPKLICAALVLAATTSCTSRDTKAAYATSSPECKQAAADEDHVVEKVGRTIFWLEIKLLEQSKKASSQCNDAAMKPF
ncbi:hypothetical protein IHQ71_16510 [Rhizobium sp. TH2]|uniref:hypothetical protein n=1 Tax=Rhizobium sp. TH2 TaxID=2775403 RepID=UPI0021582135|nr:hypothetical protein [Rhizobium sp. TH2]UVC06851.1 hypothetical protein IHQ71_16510 [Rhizobium sp. TH2]